MECALKSENLPGRPRTAKRGCRSLPSSDLPLLNVRSNIQLIREARPRLGVEVPVAVGDGFWLDLCIFVLELVLLRSFYVCTSL